ncbi:hypothetical protein [Coxiella endosymbiont of Ornithodoros amblus]|uniref:hypothetical protein n=1 Tax=Coxiella endosymbiont of Ornithodoros amblus TaxID=1656166 RepID=UPI00244DBDB0|nr:hypothetical protein [Coxiella endosymbiont of Ornithodoros amblus]
MTEFTNKNSFHQPTLGSQMQSITAIILLRFPNTIPKVLITYSIALTDPLSAA